MKGLKYHQNAVRIIDFGMNGSINKPNGTFLINLTYILMEYVQGDLLFDVCFKLGGMGEDAGRYFMK